MKRKTKAVILKALRTKKKGSVFAYALIVLSFMLVVAAGIASVALVDQKSSSITTKTTQAFQVADSGVEDLMKQMASVSTVGALTGCDAATGRIKGQIAAGKTYDIAMYRSSGVLVNCANAADAASLLSVVSKLKSTGYYGGTERVVEVSLQSNAPYPAGCNIETCADLQTKMNANLSGDFILCKDIDCTGYPFTPVGTQANAFEGTFDGKNFTISNLTINDNLKAGLFGHAYGATIKDVAFVNPNITGSKNAGTLAATLDTSTASGISVSNLTMNVNGTITDNNVIIGGIVGECYKCDVDNSAITSGTIDYNGILNLSASPWNYVELGGAIGAIDATGGTNFSKLFSNVTINHGGDLFAGNAIKIGEITGFCMGNAILENSYAHGTINVVGAGNDTTVYAGGFMGGNRNCGVVDVYATTDINGTTTYFAGLNAINQLGMGPVSYQDAFWNTDASSIFSSEGGTGKTTAQLQDDATFTGRYDLGIWRIVDGNYPCLKGITPGCN